MGYYGGCSIGALIIRIGFGGMIYDENKDSQNSIGNYSGLYIKLGEDVAQT